MTPKEKAGQLVIKMYQPLPASKEAVKGKEHLYYNQWNAAKQCALIAVNEILEIVRSDESAIIVELQFWEEVKKELSKL